MPAYRPAAIVVHTTDGSLSAAIAWLAGPSEVSAHYVVGLDGSVASLVDEDEPARHAGRVREPTAAIVRERGGDPNLYTIGVEFEDGGEPLTVTRTSFQYDAGARLIAAIAERWGIPLDREHVIGHREIFAAKACPGNLDIDSLLDGTGPR
jgi:N-acetyl-anhydromuramyl-L-alanine amidase AmpD